MAKRRMFSIDVVGQDSFLDMPSESRELYFQLGMYADDEGFVSPKKVMRLVGASDDNLKLLVAKGFILPFESGVIVIRHWNQNNYIQRDRFTPTVFQPEKRQLTRLHDVYSTPEIEAPKKEAPNYVQVRKERKAASELPFSFEYKMRQAFFEEQCPVCFEQMTHGLKQPTIQHCVPFSKGGEHKLGNIAVVCRSCNESIKDKETDKLNAEQVSEVWMAFVARLYTQGGREDKEEGKKERLSTPKTPQDQRADDSLSSVAGNLRLKGIIK